jgi:hypothetical protein
MARKLVEGEYLARKSEMDVDVPGVIEAFERLTAGKGKERASAAQQVY